MIATPLPPEQFFRPAEPLGMPACAMRHEAYHENMARFRSEVLDPNVSDSSVPANVLLRDESEDEEEENERKGEDDDDDGDGDGYSE